MPVFIPTIIPVSYMQSLALLLAGYSVFSIVLALFTHLRANYYHHELSIRSLGILLLIIFLVIQLSHFAYLAYNSAFVHTTYYQVLLFASAPIFYVFSKSFLPTQLTLPFHDLLHLLPILLSPFLSFHIALTIALCWSLVYLVWFARHLSALRPQMLELNNPLIIIWGLVSIELSITLLSFTLPWLGEKLFFSVLTSALGLVCLLLNLLLYLKPQLPLELIEVSSISPNSSLLTAVDGAGKLMQLANLMDQAELFRQPDLDLATLAQHLNLSSSQLAELIYQQTGKYFSRYLQDYRVEAAEDLLIDKPSMPIATLAIEAGFNSLSDFYTTFTTITGIKPEIFRQIHHSASLELDQAFKDE